MSQNTAFVPAEGDGVDGAESAGWGARRVLRWMDPTQRRAAAALLIRVLGAAIAYLMQILLARWMGLAEYGVFVGVWVWLLVLGGVAPLGLNVSAIGMLSQFKSAEDLERWRGLLVVAVGATMVSGLMMAGAGFSALYFMPGLVNDVYLMPVWLCLFCVPLLALSEINEGISRAHGWMYTALMPTYLLRPVLLTGGALVALESGMTLNAALVMAMAIMASVVTVIVQGAVLIRRLAALGGRGRFVATPWLWVIASLPIVLAQTFELITQNFDMIAVAYFLGPEKTGVYFAALKTIAMLGFVPFAVGAASANRVAVLHAAGAKEELRSTLDGATNLTFWPTLAGAILIVALAPWLLSLFGKDFAAHAYLTAVLAVGFVAKSFVGPAELYLNVLGHQKICALTLLVAALVNVGLNIVLIPAIGLAGAAIATSVALVVLAASLFVIVKRRIGVRVRPTIPMTTLRKLLGNWRGR